MDHSPVIKHNSIELKQIMLLVLYTKAHQMEIQTQKAQFRNYSQGIRMGFACQSIEFGFSFIFSLI